MKSLKTILDYSSPKPPDIIYHYCSVESMLSILDNSCIWLSDSTKTNDNTEIHWLLNNVGEIYEEVLDKYKSEYDGKIYKKIRSEVEEGINYIKKEKVPYTEYKRFLACFSGNCELLSQWRAYGNNGFGVALGFDSKFFCTLKNNTLFDFTNVKYIDNDKNKKLYNYIDDNLKPIIAGCIERNSIENLGLFDLKTLFFLYIYALYEEGYHFKNHHFKEEEWRLYRVFKHFYEDNDNDEEFDELVESAFADNLNHMGSFTRSRLKFIPSNSDIKCYIELGFEKIKSQIIKKIVLGPKCTINELDLKLYLSQRKYIKHKDDKSIEITYSKIPYV